MRVIAFLAAIAMLGATARAVQIEEAARTPLFLPVVAAPMPVPRVTNLVRALGRAYGNLGLTRDGQILAWGSAFVAR